MFHVQKLTDDEIVFKNKATGWQTAIWIGALWLLGQGLMFGCWLGRWILNPPPTEPWYLYMILILVGLPIVAITVRRADCAQRWVVLRRGETGVTVRLGDREWKVLLPAGVAPTEAGFASTTIPWRKMGLHDSADQQAASEILARFTNASENRRPSEECLWRLQAAGVEVVGYDDEGVSIAGAGNVRVKRVAFAVLATMGTVLVPMTAMMLGLVGALVFPRGFILFEIVPSSFISWTCFWSLSLPGPFILVREMSPYNVMTFWRGKGWITLYSEGRGAPRNCRVSPEMIHQESIGGDPGGNVKVGGLAWGCMPQYGHGESLVECLRELVAPKPQQRSDLSL